MPGFGDKEIVRSRTRLAGNELIPEPDDPISATCNERDWLVQRQEVSLGRELIALVQCSEEVVVDRSRGGESSRKAVPDVAVLASNRVGEVVAQIRWTRVQPAGSVVRGQHAGKIPLVGRDLQAAAHQEQPIDLTCEPAGELHGEVSAVRVTQQRELVSAELGVNPFRNDISDPVGRGSAGRGRARARQRQVDATDIGPLRQHRLRRSRREVRVQPQPRQHNDGITRTTYDGRQPHGENVTAVIGDRWGVTDTEIDHPYPCDDWVPSPTLAAWRGVTVDTSADRLWPWVTQVRLGPYSYDWLDNLGHRSPRRIVDLPTPAVGDRFTRAAGIRIGRILSVDPPRQLTGHIAGTVISYVLDQQSGTSTRLLMKLVSDLPRPLAALLSMGDLAMARRQLLNWKKLAESVTAEPT